MTLNTSTQPYFDDFDETKKFYKILFKPGLAVQARELTQLQTQIQHQIAKFGEAIFQDGTVVLNGQRFFENNLTSIKLDATYAGVPITIAELEDKEVTGVTSGTKGIVKAIQAAAGAVPNIIIVKETAGSGFINGEDVTYVHNAVTETVKIQAASAVGNGMMFSIADGVFFIDGKFVYSDAQTVIVDAETNTSSKNIGFVVTEQFISSDDDESLLDNAQGAPNFAAPGADRYYIDLVLTVKNLGDDVDNFIEIARVVDGELVVNNETTIYSEISKELARRTYDESGDYTVRNFPIVLKDHATDVDKFTIVLDPGKAYVRGFELSTINQTYITADRARTTQAVNNTDTSASYGNFVYVTNVLNAFNTTTYSSVELHNVARASVTDDTTKIGTAKVRYLKYHSGTVGNTACIYRMSLFDIVMDAGKLFADTESIIIGATTPTSGANIDLLSKVGGSAGGDVFLSGADTPTLVFPLNHEYIQTIRDELSAIDTDYTCQRTFESITFTAGVNSTTIQTADGTERFFGGAGAYSDAVKDQYYHVVVTNVGTSAFSLGEVIRFNTGAGRSITGGTDTPGNPQTLTLNANVGTNFTGTVIATINVNAAQEKSKTLSNYTLKIISSPNTVVGNKDSLAVSDIFQVYSVWNTGSTNPTGQVSIHPTTGVISWGTVTSNVDVSDDYTTDDGQRDEFYDHGAVVLTGTPPASTDYIVVFYKNFSHTGSGYLSVDSYTDIDYEDIPVFTSPSTGREYKLRDCYDFRPRKQDGGSTFLNGEIPDPDTTINADYQFYLPRIDTVLATSDKQLIIKQGIPSTNPLVPTDESNSMRLYILSIPPYTDDLSEVSVKYIENKRYTMRDIGRIERRVENIEYYTQLSLLEKQAQDESVPDASNLEKFKNGIVVDPFVGHSVGDGTNLDYRCSVDPTRRELRPFYEVYNTEFSFGTATNTTVNGDTVSLDYTETPIVSQLLATKTVNINPFNVISYSGTITLEPSQDIWVDTTQLPPINAVVEENQTAPDVFRGVGRRFLAPQPWQVGMSWNQNMWGWTGFGWGWNNWGWANGWNSWWWPRRRFDVTTQQTIQESTQSLGNNVVDVQFQPFLREKTIFGIGEGFKPLAEVYPFIDDTDVAAYARPLTKVVIQNMTNALFNDKTGEYEALTFRDGGVAGSIIATAKVALITPPTTADNTKRLLFVYDVVGNIASAAIDTVVGEGAPANYATVVSVTQYSLGDPITPDEFGLLAYELQIPGGTFRTGERTIRLIDNVDNDTTTTESSGEAKYFAQGQIQTKQESLLTTRAITTSRVVRRRWVDPLAQSFLIDSVAYPEGLHITSIDVFFKTKSATAPVTMELRRMVNGYPESTQTIPFGTVQLYPENINTSADGSTATTFAFDLPVHLVPGEYCFVLLANSQDYEVYVAEMGKTIVGTNQKVTQQPYAGVLFKSQNASTWTAEQLEDMKFEINRAVFESTGTVLIVNDDPPVVSITGNISSGSPTISSVVTSSYNGIGTGMLVVGTGIPAGTTITAINSTANTITMSANASATTSTLAISLYPIYEFSMIGMNSSVITPTTTNVTWKVKARNKATGLMDTAYTNFDNNQEFNMAVMKNVYPKAQNSNTNSIIIEATLTSANDNVSPTIDLGRTGLVMLKNVVNNDSTYEGSTVVTAGSFVVGKSYIIETVGTTNFVSIGASASTVGVEFIATGVGSGTGTASLVARVGGNATARYITKKVTLADGFDASNIVATMDINKPSGTDVKVYYKALPIEKNSPFDNESWIEMELNTTVLNSTDDLDYREHKFYPPNAFDAYGVPTDDPISPRFNNFAIKIVMLSSNETVVPKIRDLRVIAIDS